MTPADAKRIVLVGTVGAGTLATVATLRRGHAPSFRVAVGVLIAGTILAAGAEVAPELSAAFAVMLVVSAAFTVGTDAFEGIAAITSPNLVSGAAAAADTAKTKGTP